MSWDAALPAELEGDRATSTQQHDCSVELDSQQIHELTMMNEAQAELEASNQKSIHVGSICNTEQQCQVTASECSSYFVSPFSSMTESNSSVLQTSWTTSQTSVVSPLQSYVSMSMLDDQGTKAGLGPDRPRLPPINTQWLAPPEGDSPVSRLTESPTEVTEHDRHELQLHLATPFSGDPTQVPEPVLSPPACTASFPSDERLADDLFGDQSTWAEGSDMATRMVAGKEPPFILGNAASPTPMDLSHFTGAGTEHRTPLTSSDQLLPPETIKTIFNGPLAACRQHADSLRQDCPCSVAAYLRRTFNCTRDHFQDLINEINTPKDLPLPSFWNNVPSIEAGIEGIRDLMLNGQSNSEKLVSLLLLSFSLLCVSIPRDEDFDLAVLCLHQCASTWADLIAEPLEAISFPDFVEQLWGLVEHDGSSVQVPRVGLPYSSLQTLVSAYEQSHKDFVIEIARIFINCKTVPCSSYQS